jgi:hypothetical protein
MKVSIIFYSKALAQSPFLCYHSHLAHGCRIWRRRGGQQNGDWELYQGRCK